MRNFLAATLVFALTVSAQTSTHQHQLDVEKQRDRRTQQQPPANQETAVALQTAGMLNGRFWATIGSTGKLGFVAGFVEALGAAGVADAAQAKYYSSATLGEIVKGLDHFYEDPANAAIPAMAAIEVFASKVKGASPELLGAEVAILRGLSSDGASAHATARLDDIYANVTTGGGEAAPIDLRDLGAIPVDVREPTK